MESPYIERGQAASLIFFISYVIINPYISIFLNSSDEVTFGKTTPPKHHSFVSLPVQSILLVRRIKQFYKDLFLA